MLSGYAKSEWLTITAVGVIIMFTLCVIGWYIPAGVVLLVTIALLLFFRDPDRTIPTQRGIVTAPADGRVSSVHTVEHYEPFGESAVCIRIFLSVLDVHINRAPCHCSVESVTHKPGAHLNVLNPQSAEDNESITIILNHPIKRVPVAAVRQVAGLLARTIVCAVKPEQTLQRGQRIGMIKLGSTTEVYLPARLEPRVVVEQGQYVYGGTTVVAHVKSSVELENVKLTETVATQKNQSQNGGQAGKQADEQAGVIDGEQDGALFGEHDDQPNDELNAGRDLDQPTDAQTALHADAQPQQPAADADSSHAKQENHAKQASPASTTSSAPPKPDQTASSVSPKA